MGIDSNSTVSQIEAKPESKKTHQSKESDIQQFMMLKDTDMRQVSDKLFVMVQASGMGKTDAHKLLTSIYELAQNQIKHAGGGQISLRRITQMEKTGIEVIAEDQGPGIADIGAAMKDGYSTRDSLGMGMGGIQRLMDEFIIDKNSSQGTRIIARKWA